MKSFVLFALALKGANAFPSVMNTRSSAGSGSLTAGQTGCTTSKLCDTPIAISDATIGYNPKAPTALQKASAARDNCGAINTCVGIPFDAADQLVSVTGAYAYASPTKFQLRGPCPGLNAAANHGYLQRSGVNTILQTITGLGEAYNMSPDLAGILAAYAVALDGDTTSLTWSIGGPQTNPSLLSSGQGISWSHNKYEGDSSIARCDAYTNGGDAHSLSTTRFQYAYDSSPTQDYTFDTFDRAFTANTFRSIKSNKDYFAPLFSTTLVSPAAYNFVIAFMSNHTEDNNGGYLNGPIFKEFFAVTGDSGKFKWNPGQERIPNNWYRRPSASQYQAVTGVFGDLIPEYLAYPDSFRFGGAVDGKYVGIDIANFTNGVYSAGNLFKGDNFACFVYQTIQQGLPDVATVSPFQSAGLGILTPYLDKAFGAISCPSVSKFNNNDLPPYAGRGYSPAAPKGAPTNC